MQKMLVWIQRHRHLGITVMAVTAADPIQIPIEFALKLRRLDIAAKTDALKQSPIQKIKPLLAIYFAMRCKRTA